MGWWALPEWALAWLGIVAALGFPRRAFSDLRSLFAQIWDRSQYLANLTPLSTLRPGSSQFTTSRRQGHDPRRGLASKGFKSTVSRYLPDRITDCTCDAIAQAIRELDYRPNTAVRNLTRNHSGSSGCSATTSGGHGTESS